MKCVIMGGGVSGLCIAHYMRMAGINSEILLLEASNRLGGWIECIETPTEALFINGPRTIKLGGIGGISALKLAESLNLAEYIIPYRKDSVAKKYIKVNDTLLPIGLSPGNLFRIAKPFNKPMIFTILKEMSLPKIPAKDDTVYNFFERRFNKQFADYLADPLIRGTFAGDAKKISIKSALKNVFKFEQEHGSVCLGAIKTALRTKVETFNAAQGSNIASKAVVERWESFTFLGGLPTLIDSLEKACIENDVEIKLNSPVIDLERQKKGVLIKTEDENYQADYIFSAVPANRAWKFLSTYSPEMAKTMKSIPYTSVAIVNLEFEGEHLEQDAFGYLVPSNQEGNVLGVIFDSSIYPVSNTTVVTVMMRGYGRKGIIFGTEDQIIAEALKEINTTLFNINPVSARATVLRDCIPQYILGHEHKINNLYRMAEMENIPLFLAGNSYKGIGVADTIMNSEIAVNKLQSIMNDS